MDCSTPGFPVLLYLLKFTQTPVHWVSDAIQPSHPLNFLLFPPSVFPSIRVFSNGSVLCIRWPKWWSFSFNISPSNECSGLISFRINWFDLLGNLKSLLVMLSHSVLSNSSWILWTWVCQASLFIGFFQTWILEWVAISSPRGSSQPRDWTHLSCVFCIGRQILYYWAPWEAPRSSPAPHSKALILPHSAFFMVQLSYQYMTTGKTIALTIWTFVSKAMSAS